MMHPNALYQRFLSLQEAFLNIHASKTAGN
jgi:hypothetical protein